MLPVGQTHRIRFCIIQERNPLIASRYAQRFVLFQTLYEASQQSDQQDWQALVAKLSQGQQLAERAQLAELANTFAAGQRVVMEELRGGGVFLPWELNLLQLGLAVGDLPTAYRRLAEHYRFSSDVAQRFHQHLRLPLVLVLGCATLTPLVLMLSGYVSPMAALWALLLAAMPLLLVAGFGALQRPPLPRRIQSVAFALPGLGRALHGYQNYLFVANLTQCIGGGFGLGQALRQSARRMPDSPATARYVRVAAKVEQGQPLSAALLENGVLRGVALQRLPEGMAAQEAPAQLSLALHQASERQLQYWAAVLPFLLLTLVPWVMGINAWFLGR